jgi:hypothetical protein
MLDLSLFKILRAMFIYIYKAYIIYLSMLTQDARQ